ncbi:membrane protein insertion efficiency factor YidD [Candidatus Endolissoclinum faulkneri]|uniref:membrane protein insertion efficiency factor YidD n=1 Tax=Candidatus Endolissoclinum faulkneri TaxID=1263979 RepID=UPI002220DAF3|nr:membrane protein insertion efficiency factor YidD [Candidatus Endolissoclinum faulkneri]
MSPLFVNCCRYQPTCSAYALEVIRKYGLFLGYYLTIKRLLKCHPWGNFGFDPASIITRRIKDNSIKLTWISFLNDTHPECPKYSVIKMNSLIIATVICLAMIPFVFSYRERVQLDSIYLLSLGKEQI